MTRDELVRVIAGGRAALVDVLSAESYAIRHIDGAINVPIAEIATRAGVLLPDRGQPIVVYCGGPT